MLTVLRHRTYRHLFAAQVLSLIGTGLTTVTLGLLAYDLAGANAGAVLGTALAIKMIAYVGVSQFAGVLTGYLPRRTLLVGLDLARAAFVLVLPFVTEIWQVYALVFAFQSMSALFTPTFQGTIPDILPDEREYTNALSLSRLAYDLETLFSPLLAGLLLTVISFHWLFLGTVFGFLASAALVVSVALPVAKAASGGRFVDKLTRGIRVYLATPRLRGLLAVSFAASSGGAMVIVNTVVVVRADLGGTNDDVAFLFAAYGLGSMAVAILLSRLLDRAPARTVMLTGASAMAGLLIIASTSPGWTGSLILWALLGAAASAIGTPGGLLLRRSSDADSRPAVFAAQFALSHACWLVTYPAAGWLGATIGLGPTFLVMAAGAAAGAAVALVFWPANDPVEVEHVHQAFTHETLHVHDDHHRHQHEGWEGPEPHRHPHRHQPIRHRHALVIDDHHATWPTGTAGG
ncbi:MULTISPECIES: MFS transporter [Aurantimonas]|uniref:MFS transporter n=1 Tax=Aurantimonas TaxID=182269 RepID=UPI001652AE59|nr:MULTISPECIES: MFS transporter [Aurantimonas]MBC6718558.1 MFS transporter [Aurantimonas sp. DM33-3]MCD1642084.1 MFS transporter [Aurantimonas coralicida]